MNKVGYDVVRTGRFPSDMDTEFHALYEQCKEFTMTSVHRMYVLYSAVKYVVENNIDGDIVECGVWRGGSSMMSASTLLSLGKADTKLYLYDTFAGMSEPTKEDVNPVGISAQGKWEQSARQGFNDWAFASLEDVRANMLSTGYPEEKIEFVKGKVEDTVPETIPDRISLLRLDTDWYASTYHELQHLFPRLSPDGILILDDYGYWRGAKEATDKYFAETGTKIFLNRIDGAGRVAVKRSL